MPFDSKPAELQMTGAGSASADLFDSAEKPAKGWARANPDSAMAYLYVVQRDDDGLIQEILSA